jgi:hypothetical protein
MSRIPTIFPLLVRKRVPSLPLLDAIVGKFLPTLWHYSAQKIIPVRCALSDEQRIENNATYCCRFDIDFTEGWAISLTPSKNIPMNP